MFNSQRDSENNVHCRQLIVGTAWTLNSEWRLNKVTSTSETQT